MPRAQSRDARSAQAPGGDGEADGALHVIVAGLIARLEASPLMRRPPAECTPGEQEQLIAMLRALAEVRAIQTALSMVPGLPLSLVEGAWPELASLLTGSSRASRRSTPAPDESGELLPEGSGPRPLEAAPLAPEPEVTAEVAFVGDIPLAAAGRLSAPPPANGGISPRPVPAVTNGISGVHPAVAGRDLREQVRGVLRTDHRPWSGSRIAARVQEADPLVTKEEVYNTLHRHSDVFRRTGHGWELIAR